MIIYIICQDKLQACTFSELNLLLDFCAKLNRFLGVVVGGQREDVQKSLLYLKDEVVVGVEHLLPILELLLQILQVSNFK